MTEEKITLKINDKGEIELETRGIYGPSCLDEVNKLLNEVAAITAVNKTDEYYIDPKVRVGTKTKEVVKQ